MASLPVWDGIDQLAFYERSIFLEACARSQVVEEDAHNPRAIPQRNGADLPWARNFLDDFALVAAGPGGPTNVAAACLEFERDRTGGGTFTIRVAKNSDFSAEARSRLSAIEQAMNRVREADLTVPEGQDLCFDLIAKGCQRRMLEQIRGTKGRNGKEGKKGLVDFVGKLPLDPLNDVSEIGHEKGGKAEDREVSGESSVEGHDLEGGQDSPRLAARRWTEMKQLVCRLQGSVEIDDIKRLARLAYDARHSLQLRALLRSRCKVRYDATQIIDKLGKIAKFFRSAVTIINVAASAIARSMRIRVVTVDSISRNIDILQNRTVGNIKQRIPVLRDKPKLQVDEAKRFLGRWQKYVVHAEMLLLVFYEEHPEIVPATNYIGISKRSCYLCANFMRSHGGFDFEGQHMQLYCLWTLPERIRFGSGEHSANFARALNNLQLLVARRVAAASAPFYKSAKALKESAANFSRVTVVSLGGTTEVLDTIGEDEEYVVTVASSATLVEGKVDGTGESIEEDRGGDAGEDTDDEDETDSLDGDDSDIQPEIDEKEDLAEKSILETVREVSQEAIDNAESSSVPTSPTLLQEQADMNRSVSSPISPIPVAVPVRAGILPLQNVENEIRRERKRRRRTRQSPHRSRRDNSATRHRRHSQPDERRSSNRTFSHAHRRSRKRKQTRDSRSIRASRPSPVSVSRKRDVNSRSHSTRKRGSRGRSKRDDRVGCFSIAMESLRAMFVAVFHGGR